MFTADVSNDSNRGDDDTVSLLSSDTTLSPLRSPTPSTSMMTYPGTFLGTYVGSSDTVTVISCVTH